MVSEWTEEKTFLVYIIGQNESAKFWLSVLDGLKNRGVKDILIACVDGLTGFPQPQTTPTEETALVVELDAFEEKWSDKYPKIA